MDEVAAVLQRILTISPKPRPLTLLTKTAETLDERKYDIGEQPIAKALEGESWAGPVHRVLKTSLARWDHAREQDWSAGTAPNTAERRLLVYELLGLGPSLRAVLDEKLPFFSGAEPLIVIADRFTPWYSDARRIASTFYWDSFAGYLESHRGWDPDAILALDDSTTEVIQRLSDPTQDAVYQAKGLVVGYVQSGKTANITGLIAKAGDAGYRLAIVLTGTMNILRAQTQRRIDSELLGKELIRPKNSDTEDTDLDYILDNEWANFNEHGARPSELGAFDWIRLTGEEEDYQRLRAGIWTLNFESKDPRLPFHHPDNLQPASGKLLVVKKNTSVLRNLAKDLQQISSLTRLAHVPALVIDDESDLASINTYRPPTGEEERKRTVINRRIVDLMRQLPRAQYVGYTATPFANVFVNPADAEDMFPKDFIVSLPRPKGYMGASDFHDLAPGAGDNVAESNRLAYVRDVAGSDEDPGNLLRAIDTFVLAGAIKLYRQVELPSEATLRAPFRHHTMLIHSSRLIADQRAMAERVAKVLSETKYEGGEGMGRLGDLFESDFAPVSSARSPHWPFPARFGDLRPYLGKALTEIWSGPSPILVVNGEPGNEDPDFDKMPTWKILIGGAKLSRGYTVEGLTVSYFRRTARAGDTLMQMGRWFGFREYYSDLVRVFIGRDEGAADGRRRGVDIYEAFEAICRDELQFREELARYALPDDGSEPITPMQVPPLVASHLEWVPPTSRNKMFNAEIKSLNFGGRWSEKTVAPSELETEKRRRNQDMFARSLGNIELSRAKFETNGQTFDSWTGIASPSVVLALVANYRWSADFLPMRLEQEFMGRDDAGIDDWLIIAPQLQSPFKNRYWPVGGHSLTVKYRARVGLRVGAFSEPVHRAVAEAIIGDSPCDDSATEAFRRSGRGVMLFYPAVHQDMAEIPTMGFALLFPRNSIPSQILFGVVDASNPNAPIVDVAD
jgi:hypothetical protein